MAIPSNLQRAMDAIGGTLFDLTFPNENVPQSYVVDNQPIKEFCREWFKEVIDQGTLQIIPGWTEEQMRNVNLFVLRFKDVWQETIVEFSPEHVDAESSSEHVDVESS